MFFFRKRNSPEKYLQTGEAHFWQSVEDSLPEYFNFPRQFWKKIEKKVLFEKMTCLKTFISKQGRDFDKQAKQNRQKIIKQRSKYKNNFSNWLFFGNYVFPPKCLLVNVESTFDNCADKSLTKIRFFTKLFGKNRLAVWKYIKLFSFFSGKFFSWRCFSGQINTHFQQSVEVFLPKSREHQPKFSKKFLKTIFHQKRDSFLWQKTAET